MDKIIPLQVKDGLPDYPVKEGFTDIEKKLRDCSSLALEAPTGSGKTTLLPLLLMSSDLSDKKIILTQPRRIAAKSVAVRMSRLLGTKPGTTVGYRVRGESCVSDSTRIEVVTEGYAVALMQKDPFLSEYGWIILDEFHERHLDGDLLFAMLRDLRTETFPGEAPGIILMTATWQGQPREKLNEFVFHSIEGRLYPVENVHYPGKSSDSLEKRLLWGITKAAEETEGKVLAFLPGRKEIQDCRNLLKGRFEETEISVLHGGLQLDEQSSILNFSGRSRQIILSTSIAETSLTIEGVTAVVDSGLERMPLFSPSSALTSLVTRRLSRAVAEQRSGRAGRLGPGKCFRLWTPAEDMELIDRWEPEILTGDLSGLCLQAAVWGKKQLPWLTPPPAGAWAQAEELLRQLDAVDAAGRTTEQGKLLNRMPLPPRLSHMVAAVSDKRTAAEAAAILSEGLLHQTGNSSFSAILTGIGKTPEYGRIKKLASDILQSAGTIPEKSGITSNSMGIMLALAFPDRIGRQREPGIYAMIDGSVLKSRECQAEWAVFPEIAESNGFRIGLAHEEINYNELSVTFPNQFVARSEVRFNPEKGDFSCSRFECFGFIRIKNLPSGEPSQMQKIDAVKKEVERNGLRILPVDDRTEQFLKRVNAAISVHIEDLPQFDENALIDSLEDWLSPWLSERLTKDLLFHALEDRLGWKNKEKIDRLLPEKIELRGGQSKTVDYSIPGRPVVRGRMQEFYGLNQLPLICEGRINLSAEMLSPAMRPLQTTSDLEAFWSGSYAAIRAEMRGRYPKHYWPENPATAEPSKATGKNRPE